MKKALAVAMIILLTPMAQVLSPHASTQPSSPSGAQLLQGLVFYVSPTGNDSNTGLNINSPFQTVQRAITAVEVVLKAGLQSDITVLLRGGIYYLSKPITFGPQDSGNNGYEVVYRSYPGENATLVGGQLVTDWQAYQGSIYRAYVGTGWKFYTLYENGIRSVMARTPATGWLAVQAPVAGYNTTRFVYRVGDLPNSFDYSNAQVEIWSGVTGVTDWPADIISIKNIDFANRTITLSSSTTNAIGAGNRYFVQDSKDLLTLPGEFYLNQSQGYLYYWPKNTPISQQQIIAPTVERIIDVEGSQSSPVHDVVFEDLTLMASDFLKEYGSFIPNWNNATVFMTGATRISVMYSTVEGAGSRGIELYHYAQNNLIYGNLIENVGADCVVISDWTPPPVNGAIQINDQKNIVSHNLMRNCGQLFSRSQGIAVVNSANNIISFNVVMNVPYDGIALFGQNLQELQQWVNPNATIANYRNFVYERNNTVEFNDVSHFMCDGADGGGIYAWGTGGGDLILNNLVHDATGIPGHFLMGIYLDNEAYNVTVRSNIIYGVNNGTGGSVIPAMLGGWYDTFTNNVVVSEGVGPASPLETRDDGAPYNDHVTITKNVFFGTQGSVRDAFRFSAWSQVLVSASDYNLFYLASGSYFVAIGGWWNPQASELSLASWQSTYGFDKNSVQANPLFSDPSHNNYTLSPNSPALRLGFVNIDTKDVGLPLGSPFLSKPVASRYNVNTGKPTSPVVVFTNSTVSRFSYSQPDQKVQFYVDGRDGTHSSAQVSIPRGLLNGQVVILLDGVSYPFTESSNSTYDTMGLSYGSGMQQVAITTFQVVTSTSTVMSTTTTTASATITSTSTATATTTSTVSSTSLVTSTTLTTSTVLATQSSGGGGIPEFPYQALAVILFTAFLAISYLTVRRRRTRLG